MTSNCRFKFIEGAQTPPEELATPDKAEWPNVLDIVLNRRNALWLAQELLCQAEALEVWQERAGVDKPAPQTLTVTLVGKLEPNDDE